MRHRSQSAARAALGALLAAALLPFSSHAQGYTFGPGNYNPPSGGSTATGVVQGNQTQVTGTNVTGHLQFPAGAVGLQAFPGVTFVGNGGCSPHSPQDYVAVRTFVVPTLELEVPAVRWYRQTSDGSDTIPASVTYMDLPGGNLVVGARLFNFTQQRQYFNYTLITPNLVDQAAYQAALGQLQLVVQGLATGQPPWQSPGSPCNQPIPALQNLLDYLQGVQGQLGNSSALSGGLRPAEVRLPSGCIEEIDANYKGELLSGVLPSVASGDACCQQCRAQATCNVWVWCPLTSGCSTGSGAFPYLGCQLKYQANVSTGAAPAPQPDAWQRGPPTAFVSGRLAYT